MEDNTNLDDRPENRSMADNANLENRPENRLMDTDSKAEEYVDFDPNVHLKISLNPDGSLTRPELPPPVPPKSSPPALVFSKDIPLNPATNTWIRIFRPQHPNLPSPAANLPIIIDFHGGGFILGSATGQSFHKACEDAALRIPAVVVSVDYRLAPEHRLPAAYDDAVDAIRWVRDESGSDPWFDPPADRSRCFLMGNSSGGNIAFHAALRSIDLQPPGGFSIEGLILNEPCFGGERRTESELRFADDAVLPQTFLDLIWRAALPEGADRDHEFSNPVACRDRIGRLPRCLVTGHGRDPLLDRQRELVKLLEEGGVGVTARFDEDGAHAIEFMDERKGEELVMQIRDFVEESSSGLSG